MNDPLYLLQRPFFLRGGGGAGAWQDGSRSPYLDVRVRGELQGLPTGMWVIYIPYWLLMAVSGLAWVGMMIWRWRRVRAVGSTMEIVG